MRAIAALAAAATLATGCVHGDNRYAAYAGEAVLAGLGTVIIVSNPDSPPEEPQDGFDFQLPGRAIARGFGGLMIAAGAALFLTTIFTTDSDEAAAAAAPPDDELVDLQGLPGADPTAIHLTMQAHNAAVAGLCDTVQALDPRVAAADPSYHRAVFVADAAIATCL